MYIKKILMWNFSQSDIHQIIIVIMADRDHDEAEHRKQQNFFVSRDETPRWRNLNIRGWWVFRVCVYLKENDLLLSACSCHFDSEIFRSRDSRDTGPIS